MHIRQPSADGMESIQPISSFCMVTWHSLKQQ
jgi:hypothetical protein